jgi:hypothetical protein
MKRSFDEEMENNSSIVITRPKRIAFAVELLVVIVPCHLKMKMLDRIVEEMVTVVMLSRKKRVYGFSSLIVNCGCGVVVDEERRKPCCGFN